MSNIFNLIQTFIYILLLFYGGLGKEYYFPFLTASILWLIFSFLVLVLRKKQIDFPPGFNLFTVFLLFFTLNLFWTVQFWTTLFYLLIFVIGFLLWIISFNFRAQFKNFDSLVIFLALTFGVLTIFNLLTRPTLETGSFGLYKFATKNHHHIGDLWALVIPLLLAKLITLRKKGLLWLFLLVLGAYFVYLSQSRSAILSLLAGLLYSAYFLPQVKKYRQAFFLFIFLGVLLFLFFAKSKPTILGRVYYAQGVAGLVKHPYGVGVGNFTEISADPANHLLDLREFSSVAMNIILEMFTGIGVFALVFFIWFIKVLVSVLENSANKNLVAKVIFIALTVNFMFDFTYFVPTMLWLWFISLGLSQS